MTNLSDLIVSGLQFDDTIFRELGPSLKTVTAQYSSLCDRACQWLTNAETVDLTDTRVTYAGLMTLAKVCTVKAQHSHVS